MAKRVICLDLGHCETAAACPQKNIQGKNDIKVLITNGGHEQVSLTQIILTNAQMKRLQGNTHPSYSLLKSIGPFQIGKLPAYVPDGEKFLYFKVPPKKFHEPCGRGEVAKQCGITHGQVMACYAYAMLENIFNYNSGDVKVEDRSQTTVMIGCPTTDVWTNQQAQREYAKLVKTATGVERVEIIPESRAAMFSSIDDDINKVSAVKGAVVFDFGSSTADCTYMLLGRKILEFSWSLGASAIEREMTKVALSKAVQEYGYFPLDATEVADNEDTLRNHKHAYFNGMYPPAGKQVVCNFTNAATGSDASVIIRIGYDFMDTVTNRNEIEIECDSMSVRTGSWQALCRAFYQEAKKRIESATYTVIGADGKQKNMQCTLDTVVLTGGASKMDFIKSICQEVFNENHIRLIRNEINPSYTVSNGLAWVAVADSNVDECKAAAKKQTISDAKCDIKHLRDSITDSVFEKIKEIMAEVINQWADDPSDSLSVEDLQNRLENRIKIYRTQEKLKLVCADKITVWKSCLSSTMETAINNQVRKLYSQEVASALMIPNDVWKSLSAGGMSLNNLSVQSMLAKIDFSGLLLIISRIMLKISIWGTAIVFAPETFGLSLVAALIADVFVNDWASDHDLKCSRTKRERKRFAPKIIDKLGESKDEIMKDFAEKLDTELQSFDGIVDATLDTAFKIVTLQQFEI